MVWGRDSNSRRRGESQSQPAEVTGSPPPLGEMAELSAAALSRYTFLADYYFSVVVPRHLAECGESQQSEHASVAMGGRAQRRRRIRLRQRP